jgi:hypothetical protein
MFSADKPAAQQRERAVDQRRIGRIDGACTAARGELERMGRGALEGSGAGADARLD